MSMKKKIVSVLSISTLSFSLMGMASAKEATEFTVNNNSSGFKTSNVISPQDFVLNLKTGQRYTVYDPAATIYKTSNASVATVDNFGIITAVSTGSATITISNGTSVIETISVIVHQ